MTAYRTLDDLDAPGQRVLVRADLNVPVSGGKVSDLTRMERLAPTVQELADAGAVVVLLSHFARPEGRVVPDMSLAQVVGALSDVLGRPVTFVATDWSDGAAAEAVAKADPGTILLMENTRFHAGEEANDAEFVSHLASLGDAFVNDAFSTAHRAHASTEGIAHRLPSYAGRAMQTELDALGRALGDPEHPVTAVVGGAKISTKLDLLGSLSAKVDTLIIGGGMANTFLAAQGTGVGKSLCEHDLLDTARGILEEAARNSCRILLPHDVVVAHEFKAGAKWRTASVDEVMDDEMILDTGPATGAKIESIFEASKTLVWNGPLGAFEIDPFDAATNRAARCAANLTRSGRLLTVAGGGDTVAALANAGASEDFSYISTAGGAFLEWLEGKALPGVEILQQAA